MQLWVKTGFLHFHITRAQIDLFQKSTSGKNLEAITITYLQTYDPLFQLCYLQMHGVFPSSQQGPLEHLLKGETTHWPSKALWADHVCKKKVQARSTWTWSSWLVGYNPHAFISDLNIYHLMFGTTNADHFCLSQASSSRSLRMTWKTCQEENWCS